MAVEKQMRERVIPFLKPIHGKSVENVVGPGTPDIESMCGHIECKKIPDWPVRPDTPVRVPHFTSQQRSWLATRCHLGGLAYMLIQIGSSYWLYWGLWAAQNVDRQPRAVMEENALWSGSLPDLLPELQRRYDGYVSHKADEVRRRND